MEYMETILGAPFDELVSELKEGFGSEDLLYIIDSVFSGEWEEESYPEGR